jgi:hypothetical protein
MVKEDIFKPAIGNESLHQDNNDSVVRIIIFSTPKKSSCEEHYVPLQNSY